jgi:chromosome segregation ATPase
MKKLMIAVLFVAVGITSCNRAEVERLSDENRQLKAEIEQYESDINSLIAVFNDIEDNLTKVRAREERIVRFTESAEGRTDQIGDIQDEIKAIDELMQKNRENLNLLGERLKTTTGEKRQLERMISNLHSVVDSKDREIMELLSSMQDMNIQIDELYSSITDLKVEKARQEFTIEMQEKALNRGFFLIATIKELREMGVINRSGGVLGIGRVDRLADDLDLSLFTAIDIRELEGIPLDARKVELFSAHPGDSYIFRKTDDGKRYTRFDITQPAHFWQTTRTLVIAAD